jgi:glycosyltransferase involved in cell wall biosynthesis
MSTAAFKVFACNVATISGKTGLLAPPGDAEALAATMAELLDDCCRSSVWSSSR